MSGSVPDILPPAVRDLVHEGLQCESHAEDRAAGSAGGLPKHGFGDRVEPDEAYADAPEIAPCNDGYLVGLHLQPLAKEAAAQLGARQLSLDSEHAAAASLIKQLVPGAKVVREFRTAFNGFHVRTDEEGAKRLGAAGFSVWPNVPVRVMLQDSVPLVRAPEAWAYGDPSGQGLPVVGARGFGVKIAILDTGIDFTHPDLGGCFGPPCKVAGGHNVVDPLSPPLDDHYHGTHVASIAAGNGILNGVAPDANLYAYKVLNADGAGFASWIIEGIERAIDPNLDGDFSDRADVINLSLGGRGDPDDPMASSVDAAVEIGTIVVASAGNAGRGGNPTCGQFMFFNDNGFNTICSPGAARRAITVGATYKPGQFWPEGFDDYSSRGPMIWSNRSLAKPDLVAPGSAICAARALVDRVNFPDEPTCNVHHIHLTGTSMAAPHVAGAVAVVRDAHPTWTPEQVKSVLKSSGTAVGNTYQISYLGGFHTMDVVGSSVFSQGGGRLDVLRAVDRAGEPPVGSLDSITATGWPGSITGRIASADLDHWALQIAPFDAPRTNPGWKEIHRSSTLPGGALLLGSPMLPDGHHVVRLEVVDADGQTGVDHAYAIVDKLRVTAPQVGDIVRGGDLVPVGVSVLAGFTPSRYVLEYGAVSGYADAPSAWTLVQNKTAPPLAWNTAGLDAGFYRIRVTLQYTNTSFVDREDLLLYVDPTLAPGFPIHVPKESCGTSCTWWLGSFTPKVGDLEGDGNKEIVVFLPGDPPRLRVYDHTGSELWNRLVGSARVRDGENYVLADLDGDGDKEIVAAGFSSDDQTVAQLFAYGPTGSVLPGWPVNLPTMLPQIPSDPGVEQIRPIAADVDADGRDEIVVQLVPRGFNEDMRMVVVQETATVSATWTLTDGAGWRAYNDMVPLAGQLDADPALEIVSVDAPPVGTPGGRVYAHNADGSPVPGWPVIFATPVWETPALGRLDGDSRDDLVVTARPELWAFGSGGSPLPGWPAPRRGDWISDPTIGDVNGDGQNEIMAGSYYYPPFPADPPFVHALKPDGTEVAGWPERTCWFLWTGVAVGDADGDGQTDVVAPAGSHACLLYPPDNPVGGTAGGMYAWSGGGDPLAGFPKITDTDAVARPIISDLDGDGDPEIVGTSSNDAIPDELMPFLSRSIWKARGSVYLWNADE